jgi:hypothetical protein
MSALGQKATCASQKVMSAFLPKADMCSAKTNVRTASRRRSRARTAENNVLSVKEIFLFLKNSFLVWRVMLRLCVREQCQYWPGRVK